MVLARIIRGVAVIKAKPFRSEDMPFGIANGKSQIPNMKSEICDLKFRAPARIPGSTSIDTLSFDFLVA
jgi:hypothetical protein